MLIESTVKVTKERGPRPAGNPLECCYCQRPIGQSHAADCVMLQKSVVIRATFEMVVHVPSGWGVEMIEYVRKGGHGCADGLVEAMSDWIELPDANGGCFCDALTVELIRDATPHDHEMMPVIGGAVK